MRSSLPGFERSGGGVLERGSEEKVKELSDYLAGVLVVLMRARGESGGLYPVLSTVAARWRPAGESGRVAWQGKLQREAKSGGGGRARRVGRRRSWTWPAAGPERRTGGARHRRRNRAGEQTGEEDRDLNEISKISGTYL